MCFSWQIFLYKIPKILQRAKIRVSRKGGNRDSGREKYKNRPNRERRRERFSPSPNDP